MIDDLLAELKELDHVTWGDIHVALANILQSKDGAILRRNPIEEHAYEGIIQVGLQKGIEARGWSFFLLCCGNGVTADVSIPCDIIYGLVEETPCEALLSAYLEAIKHESPLPANHRAIEDRNEWNASHYLPGDEPNDRAYPEMKTAIRGTDECH